MHPWVLLTDTPPDRTEATLYTCRDWIEQGFRGLKRAGWQWQRTRRTDPVRAGRHWLVMAVATLLAVAYGTRREKAAALGRNPARLRTPPPGPAARNPRPGPQKNGFCIGRPSLTPGTAYIPVNREGPRLQGGARWPAPRTGCPFLGISPKSNGHTHAQGAIQGESTRLRVGQRESRSSPRVPLRGLWNNRLDNPDG